MSRQESEALLGQALAAVESGDYDTAVELAEKACEVDDASTDARLLLAEIALDECDFEAAMAYAEEALEIDPEDAECQLLVAEVALMLEDLVRVVGICEGILREDPGSLRARHLMAEAILDLGSAKEAAALFESILEEEEDHVDSWLGLGVARYELGAYEQSIAALKEAKTLAPDVADIHFHIGLTLERMGDAKGSERAFAKARELNPEQYPAPLKITLEAFEAVVVDVMEALPEKLREYLANVPISVEEVPSDDDLRASDPPLSPNIWGMFRGASILESHPDSPGLPEMPSEIILYRRNLERGCVDEDHLHEEIRVTLLHEIGHYLGWDEDEVAAHGLE